MRNWRPNKARALFDEKFERLFINEYETISPRGACLPERHMPQPLRRATAPIDWSIGVVANHPVLSSGVGACILAYAQVEALVGVYLAHIQWKNPDEVISQWARLRNAAGKLALVREQAEIRGPGLVVTTSALLDSYVQVGRDRAKLAHGVFGVITDRENEFAWRRGGSPAKAHAVGLAENHYGVVKQETFVYRPTDFARLAQQCGSICGELEQAIRGLTILNCFEEAFTPSASS